MTENEKLDLILSKLDKLDKLEERTTGIESDITDIKNNIAGIETDIAGIKDDITGIKDNIAGIETDIVGIKGDIAGMESDITDIKITIENEIRVNIQRVAEGHLDLSRKLNECIRLSSDIKDKQELQDIYINMHNSKLRAL